MAIHVDLSDLGTPRLDELLSKDLFEKMMDVRTRLERTLSERILNMHCNGYNHIYIVRWCEHEANVFRWSGQIFGPDEEQEAKALAAEKQGEIEIVEFR